MIYKEKQQKVQYQNVSKEKAYKYVDGEVVAEMRGCKSLTRYKSFWPGLEQNLVANNSDYV